MEVMHGTDSKCYFDRPTADLTVFMDGTGSVFLFDCFDGDGKWIRACNILLFRVGSHEGGEGWMV